MSRSEKKKKKKKSEQEHVRHFLHKTCNRGSFWEFHFVVVQNMCVQKCAARANLLFWLIRPIVFGFFLPFSLPSPLSITQVYILFDQTINIIESFGFSSGTGNIWTHNWPVPNISGAPVSHRYRGATSSNPVELLNFFQASYAIA